MNIRNVKQLGARIANGAKSKSPLTVDAAAIRELAELIAETGLTEIEIETGGQRFRQHADGERQDQRHEVRRHGIVESGGRCALQGNVGARDAEP